MLITSLNRKYTLEVIDEAYVSIAGNTLFICKDEEEKLMVKNWLRHNGVSKIAYNGAVKYIKGFCTSEPTEKVMEALIYIEFIHR